MNGGASEYVMGDLVSVVGNQIKPFARDSSLNSNFFGYHDYTGVITFPESKYYDAYSYNSSVNDHGRGKWGDATKETITIWGEPDRGW